MASRTVANRRGTSEITGHHRPSSRNHAPRRILALPGRGCRIARYERTARPQRRPQGARNAPGRPSGFDSTGIPYRESVPRAGESGRDCRKISRLGLFALCRQTGNRAEKGSLTPRNDGNARYRRFSRVWEGSGVWRFRDWSAREDVRLPDWSRLGSARFGEFHPLTTYI